MLEKLNVFSGDNSQTSLGKKLREKTKIKTLLQEQAKQETNELKKERPELSYIIDTLQFISREIRNS